jgi:hypothetical protein
MPAILRYNEQIVGHISRVRLLLGTLLVGSVALGQQGLIVEPWRQKTQPAPAQVLPSRPVAEPALAAAAARLAPSTPAPRVEVAATLAPPVKWTPPVVELTVDPWAKPQAPARAVRPRWIPQTVEIIDPWGSDAPGPRVAAAPSAGERSTIF